MGIWSQGTGVRDEGMKYRCSINFLLLLCLKTMRIYNLIVLKSDIWRGSYRLKSRCWRCWFILELLKAESIPLGFLFCFQILLRCCQYSLALWPLFHKTPASCIHHHIPQLHDPFSTKLQPLVSIIIPSIISTASFFFFMFTFGCTRQHAGS